MARKRHVEPTVSKHPQAKRDLVEAADYYTEKVGLALANRFLDAAEWTFSFLASIPEIGAVLETTNPQLVGIRHWQVKRFKKYVVFYRPIENGVVIVRLLHGARNLEKLLGESVE